MPAMPLAGRYMTYGIVYGKLSSGAAGGGVGDARGFVSDGGNESN